MCVAEVWIENSGSVPPVYKGGLLDPREGILTPIIRTDGAKDEDGK